MSNLLASFSSPFVATLVLVPVARAQNAFRPLPLSPEIAEWSNRIASTPAARANALFDELEVADEAPGEETFVSARLYAELGKAAGLDGGGDVATQIGGWSVTFGQELGEQRLAALSLSTQAFFYNLGGSTQLVPGESEPFNDLYEARLAGFVRTQRGSVPGWFTGFELVLGGEDEAQLKESLSVGGVGGLRCDPSDDFSIEMGIAALSRLEDEPWVWPFLGFRWQATEDLSFDARGTVLEGRYRFSKHWSALGRADYTIDQFRLNDDNPLPSGVLRDDRIRMALGFERRGADGVKFDVLAGFDAWRELTTIDDQSNKVAELEVDPAPFLGFSLELSF